MGVFIIAEAGVNHNGDMAIARKMIDEAAAAGCSAVKFQTFKADSLVIREAEKAEYQKVLLGNNETQYEMLKKLELDRRMHMELIARCRERNIKFMSTAFDEESADMLEELGMEIFKIPSGEITNKSYLKHIAGKHKPIILSTGMSTLDEVGQALDWIYEVDDKIDITLLHCTTCYPTEVCDVNLMAMKTMGREFGLSVGYSDHTLGIEISIAAAVLGADVIEKHFTLDKNMYGPDHRMSLEPDELRKLVSSIGNIEKAYGDGIKKPVECESANIIPARKSVVAAVDIRKGEIITRQMLAVKRPATGKPPSQIDWIIGMRAQRDYKKDEQID
jgi:N,N'-diacetyllegionaminate synthase